MMFNESKSKSIYLIDIMKMLQKKETVTFYYPIYACLDPSE